MRLRYITPLWRGGYVSTCSFQRTFLSSEAPHYGKTLENGQNLDSETKENGNGDIIGAVKLFEAIKHYTKSSNIQNKTKLLKSYCDWGLYEQAMKIVRSIVNLKVYDTDAYDLVITSMATRRQIGKAIQVFEEKLKRQQHFPTKVYLSEYVTEMIELLLNPENLIIKGEVFDEHRHTRTSQIVFRYLEQNGERLPLRLIRAIHSWLMHDPNNYWTWQNCTISEAGKCSFCGNMLINRLPLEDVRQLKFEILRLFEIPQKSTFKLNDISLEDQMYQEIEELKMFVKEKGPFDVIIDGLNVLCTESKFKLSSHRLLEMVNHFAIQQKNVMVVLSKKELENRKATRALKTTNCAVFMSSFGNDDLYLLYAAAMSGLRYVEVVTNDKLRDHRLLFPAEVGWIFSRWTRLNRVSFTKGGKGKLQFFRDRVDPVVQYNGNSWHFPVANEAWRCSRRSKRFKNLF